MTTPFERKQCSVEEAMALVEDGQTIASGGFIGSAHPEALTVALEERFLKTNKPNDLTVIYGAGQGDGKTKGINHLAFEGMVKRVIGGHWGLAPKMGKLAMEGKIEAYNFPQGVICQLFRDIAAGRPGCITHVGLGTFIDPENDGGKINESTLEELVERVEMGGKPYLWYKSFPIHVGLIKATASDPSGNLTMDGEAIAGEVLAIAQAVHNSGGIVIAQVSNELEAPINPHEVKVPGILVDRIVMTDADVHGQTFAETFNPAYCRAADSEKREESVSDPMAMSERRIIAARACAEIPSGAIVNLGIGMPEGIAKIAAETGRLSEFTLTVESGPIGGTPASGLSFGASAYPEAIIDQPAQFDFYDGGGLDFAALGAAQIDREGNVNVSRFGTKLAGVGGFVNITQSAKKLVFCGTFSAGGLEVEVKEGRLHILQEGKTPKFINEVEQVSFSALRSRSLAQKVLYITERAVFKLGKEGLWLIEIAPGIDLERDIFAQMSFRPKVSDSLEEMAPHFFRL
jgi:propionate CoA-transferase